MAEKPGRARIPRTQLAKPTQPTKPTIQAALTKLRMVLATAVVLGPASPVPAAAPAPKYYFELHDVESQVPLNGDVRKYAGEALRAELASRPEWQSDLGDVKGRQAVIAELKKRKLSGFDLTVKIAQVTKDVKQPTPGSRLKRLTVTVRLSVLGTTLPGETMAFGGDGEAGAEASVSDSRLDVEAESMTRDAIKDALKQAVDQAVLKLSLKPSTPINESRNKRRKN